VEGQTRNQRRHVSRVLCGSDSNRQIEFRGNVHRSIDQVHHWLIDVNHLGKRCATAQYGYGGDGS
jgi:hypothetical protein